MHKRGKLPLAEGQVTAKLKKKSENESESESVLNSCFVFKFEQETIVCRSRHTYKTHGTVEASRGGESLELQGRAKVSSLKHVIALTSNPPSLLLPLNTRTHTPCPPSSQNAMNAQFLVFPF